MLLPLRPPAFFYDEMLIISKGRLRLWLVSPLFQCRKKEETPNYRSPVLASHLSTSKASGMRPSRIANVIDGAINLAQRELFLAAVARGFCSPSSDALESQRAKKPPDCWPWNN